MVALIIAACGGGATETTTTVGPGTTTTPQPEAQVLAYKLSAGAEFAYDVELTQTIDMTAEGNGQGVADEEMPGAAAIEVTAKGSFKYAVADGPETGTYAVSVTGDFTDVSATGVVDGKSIDSGEIPDFAEIPPVDVTITVDKQGNIIPEASNSADPMADIFGGMENFNGIPGSSPGQFFGPPFGDEEVTVGSHWESTYETPGFGEEPITTSVMAAVTGTENVGGVDLLVIESETEVSATEFDLAEFFIGLFTGFMPEEPTAEEQAEIDAMIEGLRFAISVDPSHAESKTLFNAETGVTHDFTGSSAAHVTMDVNFPDDTTGELTGFVMDMSIDQKITLTLASGPTT